MHDAIYNILCILDSNYLHTDLITKLIVELDKQNIKVDDRNDCYDATDDVFKEKFERLTLGRIKIYTPIDADVKLRVTKRKSQDINNDLFEFNQL